MNAHHDHGKPVSRGNAGGDVDGDMLKGAIAGAVGVWVMDRVDWWMFDHVDPEARRRTEAVRPGGLDPAHRAAGQIARALGTELSPAQPNPAGAAVHYAFGVAPGALYGALRDRVPGVGAGNGLLWGLGLFALEDEIMNPAAGLAAKPRDYPWQAHARGLVAHLVYGVVTDLALSALKGGSRRASGRKRAAL